MDGQVIKAMAKWPSVPNLFGWLELDRRGRWLLRGETIERRQMTEFINRNYQVDEQGRWFFQNGPQRVFVTLEYMPLVLRVQSDALFTQTGQAVIRPSAAYLDEKGAVLLTCEHGPALLADADIPWVLDHIVVGGIGKKLCDVDVEEALALPSGSKTTMSILVCKQKVPVIRLDAARVSEVLGFQQEPTP